MRILCWDPEISDGSPTLAAPETPQNEYDDCQKAVALTVNTVVERQSMVRGTETAAIGKNREAATALLPADSEETPDVSVVLPTMNEEEGVAVCIDAIRATLESLELHGEVVVSDSSSDRTPEIARQHGAIVVEPDERGYGSAYRYAFEHVRGPLVVIGDADTTYDFTELPKLLAPVMQGQADLVMGSRFEGDIKSGAMPRLHQYVGNPLLTGFLNVFYQADVSDAHSGFRVIRRDALEKLDLTADGMEFASEMVMKASVADLRIAEVPITYHERRGDATLDSFSDGWRHLKFMLVNAPGYLFFLPGMVIGLVGTALMILGGFGLVAFGQPFGVHSAVAGCLGIVVGYQLVSFGLLTVIGAEPLRPPEDRLTRKVRELFTPERGLLLGALLLVGGLTITSMSLLEWYLSGFAQLPSIRADIVAFTAITLGLQTIFGSFFASVLLDDIK